MSEENYKFEDNLLIYYNRLLEARNHTSQALNQYRALNNNIATDNLEKQISNKKQAETRFLHRLDYYYEFIEFKFGKTDVEKPEAVKKLESKGLQNFTPHEIDLEDAILLYKKCNKVIEELGITSLENLQYERRKI